MPELPEVETTRRGLLPHVAGRRILRVIVREPRLRWRVPREVERVEGQRIGGIRRRGKYLLFDTDAGTLLIHLGMSGSLRFADENAAWKKHDHVAIALESGKQLRLHDPRRFGAVLWTVEPERHPLLIHLGPEPLEPGFDAGYLHSVLRRKSVSVKQAIMDAKVVVGVGNIYASESLFLAGIWPREPSCRVGAGECEKLVRAIREVLLAAIESGGTTLRDFVRETGEPGYFKQSLRVYDRAGLPCGECGSLIRRTVQGQRATYYCPKCQAVRRSRASVRRAR